MKMRSVQRYVQKQRVQLPKLRQKQQRQRQHCERNSLKRHSSLQLHELRGLQSARNCLVRLLRQPMPRVHVLLN